MIILPALEIVVPLGGWSGPFFFYTGAISQQEGLNRDRYMPGLDCRFHDASLLFRHV